MTQLSYHKKCKQRMCQIFKNIISIYYNDMILEAGMKAFRITEMVVSCH
jgi:hypothetical protein